MSMGSQKSDQTLEHEYTSEKHKKSPWEGMCVSDEK